MSESKQWERQGDVRKGKQSQKSTSHVTWSNAGNISDTHSPLCQMG